MGTGGAASRICTVSDKVPAALTTRLSQAGGIERKIHMNEDILILEIRKFRKEIGISSQREIE